MKVFVSYTGNYPDSSRAVPDRLKLILFNAVFKVFGAHYLDTKVSTAKALNTQYNLCNITTSSVLYCYSNIVCANKCKCDYWFVKYKKQ